jgi:hypothetical protein
MLSAPVFVAAPDGFGFVEPFVARSSRLAAMPPRRSKVRSFDKLRAESALAAFRGCGPLTRRVLATPVRARWRVGNHPRGDRAEHGDDGIDVTALSEGGLPGGP